MSRGVYFCPIHKIPMSVMNGKLSCYMCKDIEREEQETTRFDERREVKDNENGVDDGSLVDD